MYMLSILYHGHAYSVLHAIFRDIAHRNHYSTSTATSIDIVITGLLTGQLSQLHRKKSNLTGKITD